MKVVFYPVFVLLLLVGLIFSGCGGGDSISAVPQNMNTEDASPTPNPYAGTGGTFRIAVRVPGLSDIQGSEELTSSVIPYGSRYLRVTLEGDGIPSPTQYPDTTGQDITVPGGETLIINDVPVGLKIATIEILNTTSAVMAKRKAGFFMTAVGYSATFDMGVGLYSSGCDPSHIEIPVNTELYIENHDSTSHDVTLMDSDSNPVNPPGTFTLDGVTPPANSVTPHVFDFLSHVFDTKGTFTYDTDAGTDGTVVVYGVPSVTGISPGYDSNNSESSVSFTISGSDFWGNKDDVGGKVTFYKTFEWENVGNAGFSDGEAGDTSLYVYDSGGSPVPYVAYQDRSRGYRATVMKYDGFSWVAVGTPGFSAVGGVAHTSLYVYDNGGLPVPYVAYDDAGNGNRATVMKFDGSDWVDVGSAGFSAGFASYTSLYVYDNGGTPVPYVAYRDEGNGGKAIVMRFNGSIWETVGSAGFSAGTANFTSLQVYDNGGTPVPYVAYRDESSGGRATVMRFNGSIWETVGSAGFSAGSANCTSLYVYDNGGTPLSYVAYNDDANGYRAIVKKFDGSSWVDVGSAGFSAGNADFTSLQVYDDGGVPVLYVAYRDADNGYKATVMKYDGTAWSTVGNSAFSAGNADYTSLYVYNGIPYVAYGDGGNGNRATVMRFSKELKAVEASITDWQNEQIEGNITIPAGKYRVEVTSRGDNSVDDVYFGKGTGSYVEVIAE